MRKRLCTFIVLDLSKFSSYSMQVLDRTNKYLVIIKII